MNLGLNGRSVAVTGASKGIGNAIANQVAAEGANVAICARSPEPLEAAADAIESEHRVECAAIPADLTDRDQAAAFVETTVDRFGGLDVLVNNAGSAPGGGLESLEEDDWYQAIDLKFMGHVRCTTEAMPHLVESEGAVVNVIGNAGVNPLPDVLTSTTTNAADINLTKALAKDYGYRGVRVNGVNPGPVETDRWSDVIEKIADQQDVTAEEAAELVLHSLPPGRVCQPEEIATVVAFLASDRASYVNGAIVDVDGDQLTELMGFDRIGEISHYLR